jgi:hypothetical protein
VTSDTPENSEKSVIAEHCLNWLVQDVEELERFMSLSGYSPQSLRAALGSDGLDTGLIDYFGRNEPLLLAMCANANLGVERVMRQWHMINPQS